ncbi:hypothetical protein IWQ62_005976 [Dispira parvispora]|uniref:Methyltransferase domain-containing protein n=1 Tax=Dispira parvispora TaxID=1520584 RepID=A0A9W8AHM6_9FUNG|nr:hypothetical protein IWQ62_005976 [Dispira parvispora]
MNNVPTYSVVSLTSYLQSCCGSPTRDLSPSVPVRLDSKLLDFRPVRDYKHYHLYPSVNFPNPNFDSQRLFELPAKTVPLDVLVPNDSLGRPYLAPALLLYDKGWLVDHIVFIQDSCVESDGTSEESTAGKSVGSDPGWSLARKLGVLVHDGYLCNGVLDQGHHVLFDPCPSLHRSIAQIEVALGQVKGDKNWMVCDLGCGSGRDLVWLCTRHWRRSSTTPSPALSDSKSNYPQWYGLGVDAVLGGLRRVRQLTFQLNSSDNVTLCHGKFHYDGPLRLKSPLDCPDLANPSNSPLSTTITTEMSTLPTLGTEPIATLQGPFDLVLAIRFLHRPLFSQGQVDRWVAPGGFVLCSTFVETPEHPNEHPQGPKHRLQPGELAAWFGPTQGYEIWYDEIECIEDGRHVNSFLARKKLTSSSFS